MNHGIQEKEEDLEEESAREEGEVLEGLHRVSQGRPQQAHLPGMSVFIGNVKGPRHNSPDDAANVWCSPGRVELNVIEGSGPLENGAHRDLDPIAARNLAALLVRASEEAERMSARADSRARLDEGDPK